MDSGKNKNTGKNIYRQWKTKRYWKKYIYRY